MTVENFKTAISKSPLSNTEVLKPKPKICTLNDKKYESDFTGTDEIGQSKQLKMNMTNALLRKLVNMRD